MSRNETNPHQMNFQATRELLSYYYCILTTYPLRGWYRDWSDIPYMFLTFAWLQCKLFKVNTEMYPAPTLL